MKKSSLILCILFVISLLFTRFYNLDRTARFTQDEASDLRRMNEMYEQKKLTLVGPISNDNKKVFSSLTYYMVMPFAVAGGFTPVSPVYGAAFWGVLTVFLLLYSVYKINKQLLPLAAVLVLVWFPLIETSRWAWNPHFVVFWSALGIALYLSKNKRIEWFYTIALGFTIHHHYLAFVASGIFVGIEFLRNIQQKDIKSACLKVLLFCTPLVPFVIFDIRHPPGLFISKYLTEGSEAHLATPTFRSSVHIIWENCVLMLQHISPVPILAGLIGMLILILVFRDLKANRSHLMWLLPVAGQLLIGTILTYLATRYLLPAYGFLFVWLFLKREKQDKALQMSIIILLIVSSLFALPTQLTKANTPPDMYSLTVITHKMETLIKSGEAKNANVAVVASDPHGISFREYLQVRDAPMRAQSEYDATESLFVVTVSDLETIRQDKSSAISYFKNSQNVQIIEFPDTQWKLYWFRF